MQDNQAIALFKLYEELPLTSIVSFVTVLLIITLLRDIIGLWLTGYRLVSIRWYGNTCMAAYFLGK